MTLVISELPIELTIYDLNDPEKYFEDGVFKFIFQNNLVQKETVGDSEIQLNRNRLASALCCEDCDLMVMKRKYYNLILKEFNKMKIVKKIALFY